MVVFTFVRIRYIVPKKHANSQVEIKLISLCQNKRKKTNKQKINIMIKTTTQKIKD